MVKNREQKDNVGFWKSGDITINGKEFQVKRNGAQIVTFQTIHNLQKCGKNWRSNQKKGGSPFWPKNFWKKF